MSGHEDQEDAGNATGHRDVGSECTSMVGTSSGHGVANVTWQSETLKSEQLRGINAEQKKHLRNLGKKGLLPLDLRILNCHLIYSQHWPYFPSLTSPPSTLPMAHAS